MGRVIAFSDFENYFKELNRDNSTPLGVILDTNILVSLTYEIKIDHELVVELLDSLRDRGAMFFTTVNTRSEFLDFHRRLIMTEHLRDMIMSNSKWKISEKSRSQIQFQSGQLTAVKGVGETPCSMITSLKKLNRPFLLEFIQDKLDGSNYVKSF